RLAADLAVCGDVRNSRWHVKSLQLTSREFGEHQRQSGSASRRYTISLMLAIPSQAGDVRPSGPRAPEGVSTRGCGNNTASTSARRHSIGEEIVRSTASRMAQAVVVYGKLIDKNITTYKRYSGYDILNISPSDVFTAAQYPIAQAAVAVSISGI